MGSLSPLSAATIRASGPAMTPAIPPVTGLLSHDGVPITLDCEVLVNRLRRFMAKDATCFRAKVVAIGDPGLPGRPVIKIRPHGSTYIETAGPEDCDVRVFDDYAWLLAEEAAAVEMSRLGRDLSKCLFGGFWFEQFQRFAAKVYVECEVQHG
jgi:hypothetical protein